MIGDRYQFPNATREPPPTWFRRFRRSQWFPVVVIDLCMLMLASVVFGGLALWISESREDARSDDQERRENLRFVRELSGQKDVARPFRGMDLRGSNLSDLDLSGADLTGADLSGADLSGANLLRADLTDAKLSSGTIVRCANLVLARGIRVVSDADVDLDGVRALSTSSLPVEARLRGYSIVAIPNDPRSARPPYNVVYVTRHPAANFQEVMTSCGG